MMPKVFAIDYVAQKLLAVVCVMELKNSVLGV